MSIEEETASPEEVQEESLREEMKKARKLRILLASEGWDHYEKFGTAQMENRKDKVFSAPVSGMDGALEQEYMKGEIAGINLMLKWPGLELGVAEGVIQARKQQLGIGEDDDLED